MKNGTNDHRARVTKLLIRRAFLDLLQQKTIETITIKELCYAAQINRSTFYKHYADIFALKKQLEEEMLEDFLTAMEPLLSTKSESLTAVKITAGIFQCLKTNSDLCIATLGDYGDKAFAIRLIEIGRERYLQAYSRYFKDATPTEIEFYYAFISAGCIGLLRKWLDEGLMTGSEQMAQMAENIMLYGIGMFQR